MGTNWSRKSQRAFSRRSVPRTVPVTEESNPISEETDPGCGIVQEKVVAVSSCNQQPTGWEQFESTQQKKKKKRKVSEKSQLGFASSTRKKKSFSLPSTLLATNASCQLCTFTFWKDFPKSTGLRGDGLKTSSCPKKQGSLPNVCTLFYAEGPSKGLP